MNWNSTKDENAAVFYLFKIYFLTVLAANVLFIHLFGKKYGKSLLLLLIFFPSCFSWDLSIN